MMSKSDKGWNDRRKVEAFLHLSTTPSVESGVMSPA
jgi:hypothetical protein